MKKSMTGLICAFLVGTIVGAITASMVNHYSRRHTVNGPTPDAFEEVVRRSLEDAVGKVTIISLDFQEEQNEEVAGISAEQIFKVLIHYRTDGALKNMSAYYGWDNGRFITPSASALYLLNQAADKSHGATRHDADKN